ncbi:clavesin-2-like [Sitophilus oryzae]|uniref:Clavesin-2-like n=1 Tax=Sitophilus oryzae TaxID=7048 RepID=A0A6J2YD83_SITOR|nr:clavesin-2-like [Sitophilus oryzae]
MPSDTDVLYQLDLGEAPQQLQEWAQENIRENPDTRCLLIEDFKDMIYARGDCTLHRTDDAFLLRFLRGRNWSLEAAYKLLVNYYEFKEDNPEFFENVNLFKLLGIGCDNILTVPPYREQTGRRILLYRIGNWDPEKYSVTELFQATLAVLELAILEPRAQILGGVAMFDMSDLTLNQAYYMTPSIAHKVFQIMVTSFPMKIHAVHVLFQPWIFDIIFGMFKPLITGSMSNKLFFHGDDMESLHKHIDPKHLPQRYGGRHPDYDYSPWIEGFKIDEKIKKQMRLNGYIIDEDEYDKQARERKLSQSSSTSN